MSVLTKSDITEALVYDKLKVHPLLDETIRENGLDLHLGFEWALLNIDENNPGVLDLSDPRDYYWMTMKADEYIEIPPHTFALVHTWEYIKMPDDMVGLCNLRSSVARWGILAPPTVVDVGFEGELVIEVFNTNPFTIKLKPLTRFLHLILLKATKREWESYRGTYQGQRGITTPKPLKPDFERMGD